VAETGPYGSSALRDIPLCDVRVGDNPTGTWKSGVVSMSTLACRHPLKVTLCLLSLRSGSRPLHGERVNLLCADVSGEYRLAIRGNAKLGTREFQQR
jgi:hypothetical protein